MNNNLTLVDNVLGSRQERVKLLKKGFSEAQVEKQYLTGNNITIVNGNILRECLV